jgi:hypothetical protein
MKSWNLSSWLALFALGACCAPDETIAESSAALVRNAGLRVESTEFAHPNAIIPAGIAADSELLFVGAPLEGRVMVLSRRTRQEVGELPPPPGNFVLPLILHTIEPGRLAVLDAGGLPSPGVADAEPTLFEYGYSFRRGAFSAALARVVHFTGKKIGFAEEFAYLGSGRYLVPDTIYGSIWLVTSEGEVRPGIVPKTFDAADAIPELAYCRTMPEITVGGLPFLFTGSTIPGIAGIDLRDSVVYFYSSCAGALYRFPLSTLFDSRPPWRRARDFEVVSEKPAGTLVEQLLETQFNPFDRSDRHLYAADSLNLRLIRIDSRTGKREVVADDPRLFNFPSSLAFVPEQPGEKTSLFVLSNQQHRNPLTNSAIGEDLTQPPYIVTKVAISARRSAHDR